MHLINRILGVYQKWLMERFATIMSQYFTWNIVYSDDLYGCVVEGYRYAMRITNKSIFRVYHNAIRATKPIRKFIKKWDCTVNSAITALLEAGYRNLEFRPLEWATFQPYPLPVQVSKTDVIAYIKPVKYSIENPKPIAPLPIGTDLTIYEFDNFSKMYFVGWKLLGVWQYGWIYAYREER